MSYTEMSAKEVLAKCRETEAWLKGWRADEREAWTKRYVARINSGFFFKLFKRKPITMEGASGAFDFDIENNGIFSSALTAACVGLYIEHTVKELKTLALANPEGTVCVDAEDMRRLK